MRSIVAVAVFALAQQSACDSSGTKTAPTKPVAQRPPLHRFVLTRFPNDQGVAFDTQTGQLCRTWDWQPSGKAPSPDPSNVAIPQRMIGEFTPTCLSLYEKYPSGAGDSTQVIEDQQPDQK